MATTRARWLGTFGRGMGFVGGVEGSEGRSPGRTGNPWTRGWTTRSHCYSLDCGAEALEKVDQISKNIM